MKIEKISDNQVKFTLNKVDLIERNIKLSELAYGSEKTQLLFREMMQQAVIECGFEADNTPLMIEATPFSHDGIVIIVTKVVQTEETSSSLDFFSRLKEIPKQKRAVKAKEPQKPENVSIFSFDNLDQVADVSIRLYGQFHGTNVLFKDQNRYFLFLENNVPTDKLSLDDLDAVLSEYGQKHVSSVISKCYLAEHGEVIIKDTAISVMAKYLS